MILILGIDLGLCIIGFGVVWEMVCGCEYVVFGCIWIGNGFLYECLYVVFCSVCEVICIYGLMVLSIEQVFMVCNVDLVLKLGQVWGVVIVVVMEEGLSVVEYIVLQVKQVVVGIGGVDKQQVQMMVMYLLKLIQKLQIDVFDVLVIVLCYVYI